MQIFGTDIFNKYMAENYTNVYNKTLKGSSESIVTYFFKYIMAIVCVLNTCMYSYIIFIFNGNLFLVQNPFKLNFCGNFRDKLPW